MTKHESHTVLLLLALITAGVLGYQFLNGGIGNNTGAWTTALLHSNPDHSRFDHEIEIDIQPPTLKGHNIQQVSSVENNNHGDRFRYSEIKGFQYTGDEGNRNVRSATTHTQTENYAGGVSSTERVQASGSYLNSDAHLE